MNIFILAAGLGTRLKPLTDTMPKALVPIEGRPLLQILIEKIKKECERPEIVINIHHFAEQIVTFLIEKHSFDVPITFSKEQEMLLETGGGLKKAATLFANDEPILIHNVDILCNVDLGAFYRQHANETDVAATLIVSERQTKRYLLFNDENRLVGWTNIETGEVKSPYQDLNVEQCKKYAFSGIHVVSKSLIGLMDEWDGAFPIVDFYLSVCDKAVIKADVRKDLKLLDVGKLDTLNRAETMVKELGL